MDILGKLLTAFILVSVVASLMFKSYDQGLSFFFLQKSYSQQDWSEDNQI